MSRASALGSHHRQRPRPCPADAAQASALPARRAPWVPSAQCPHPLTLATVPAPLRPSGEGCLSGVPQAGAGFQNPRRHARSFSLLPSSALKTFQGISLPPVLVLEIPARTGRLLFLTGAVLQRDGIWLILSDGLGKWGHLTLSLLPRRLGTHQGPGEVGVSQRQEPASPGLWPSVDSEA